VYPYVSSQFNVDVLRADASLQGSIQWVAKPAGMELGLQADAFLGSVRAISKRHANPQFHCQQRCNLHW
jgi:hypothetical protein